MGANRLFIDEILPVLLEKPAKADAADVERSLGHWSAKIWIVQGGAQFHGKRMPTKPEILVPSWTAAWQEAVNLGEGCWKPRRQRPQCCKAIFGVRLHGPVTKLQVIGAWMNEAGELVDPPDDKLARSEELVDPPDDKLARSEDIALTGFT